MFVNPTSGEHFYTTDYKNGAKKSEGNDLIKHWGKKSTTGKPIYYVGRVNPVGFVIQAEKTGQLVIYNKWTTPIIIIGSNNKKVQVSSYKILSVKKGEKINVIESKPNVTFRKFSRVISSSPFLSSFPPNTFTQMRVKIISMPNMSSFTIDKAGTRAGDYFFQRFAMAGAITSLPKGSFDTSKIITVGDNYFADFNSGDSTPGGSIAALPAGSFNTSNIRNVGMNFFREFNKGGNLVSLPKGSFDTSKIITVGDNYFADFNSGENDEGFVYLGKLTKAVSGGIRIKNLSKFTMEFYYYNKQKNTSQKVTVRSGSFAPAYTSR
jgi:hypothetical protein